MTLIALIALGILSLVFGIVPALILLGVLTAAWLIFLAVCWLIWLIRGLAAGGTLF